MAEAHVPDTSVKIAWFAKSELADLVERLSTSRPDLKVGGASLLGALVLAAQRLPIEAIAAIQTTYWNEAEERAAPYAVYSFIVGSR
jgi:hypothetical protein